MRILAVIAHDKKTSLDRYLFDACVLFYHKQGHEVDVLDLYERADDIPFYYHWKKEESVSGAKTLNDFPFYQENQERFMAADRLLLVFPVYWYSVPGIMKCWIDSITNYAYKYEGGRFAKPLHKIKKTYTVHTASAPWWYLRFVCGNTASRQIKETWKWFGIPKNYFYEIGGVSSLTREEGERIKDKVLKRAAKLL